MGRHEGLTGRVIGIVWGAVFAVFGGIGCLLALDMADLAPPLKLGKLVFAGLFLLMMAGMAGYGLYEMGNAVLQDDYSITLQPGDWGGGP